MSRYRSLNEESSASLSRNENVSGRAVLRTTVRFCIGVRYVISNLDS